MSTKMELTDDMREEYAQLFVQASIRPEHAIAVASMADRIFAEANWERYRQVETATNVPAFVVGIIHSLEANLCFASHLHNGDPLSGRTVHVPAGRPVTGAPPFSWQDSAVDALTQKNLQHWADWSLPGIAFVLERYNGWGYRRRHSQVKSPYLWSFTTVYTAGKYVADGVWSDTAVSRQCGGLALLWHMMSIGRVNVPMPDCEDTVRLTAEDRLAAERQPEAAPAYPGHFLKKSDRDPVLVPVRQRLTACGILGLALGREDFDEGLEAAVKQFQARGQDETGHPLVIDGLLGQRTWQALFGPGTVTPDPAPAVPEAGSFSEVLLRVAAGELGVQEHPANSNSGPRVDEYLASLGLAPGNSWCAAFLYWCFEQAAKRLGLANPLPRAGRVTELWTKSQASLTIIPTEQAAKDPRLVVPGCIFCQGFGDGRGHAGLVTGLVNGRLTTIEGNTSTGVSSQPRRAITDINLGFIKAV
jgi:lysozyme family protein